MGKKKITIEDLAVIIKNGFDGVDQRFDKLEGDLVSLVDSSKRQFDEICERLGFVEKKLDSMSTVEKAVLSEIKSIKDKLETKINRGEYLDLEKRVIKLEKLAFAK